MTTRACRLVATRRRRRLNALDDLLCGQPPTDAASSRASLPDSPDILTFDSHRPVGHGLVIENSSRTGPEHDVQTRGDALPLIS